MKRVFHNYIVRFLLWWNRGTSSPRLKRWIALEEQKEKLVQALGSGGNFPSELLTYLSRAWGIDYKWFEYADWFLLIQAFQLCLLKSPHVNLPITSPSNENSKEESWDYEGRTWHLYSHLLAKAYGWTLEEISQLQVVEALAKIQEIMVDDQLDREFYHGLSEIAYHYDKNTKVSKFVPLPRPYWMRPKMKPIEKFILPKSMLPMGNVITEGVLPPEFMPKEIH